MTITNHNDFEISIIIPTFKRKSWLQELLYSIDKQNTSKKFEVVVIDDGSPNAQVKKEQICSLKLSFPLLYLQQKNAGPASARNKGIKSARGSVIVFTDDDVIVPPNWVDEITQDIFNETAHASAGCVKGISNHTLSERYLNHVEHLSKHFLGKDGTPSYLITANAAAKKDVLHKIGNFDERFPFPSGEDMDLGFRIRKHNYKISFIPSSIVLHHHKNSLFSMFKNWFIFGRGAYICTSLHHTVDTKGVASKKLVEISKITKTFRENMTKVVKNLSDPKIKKIDVFLFPMIELANHFFYQAGRISEHFFFKMHHKE